MTQEQMRAQIMRVILERLDLDQTRRAEALADFLALSLPDMDAASIRTLAAKIPQIPQDIYEKWINMFIDRLFETIPQEQLDDLTNGTKDNNTTLGMVYLLFMESARMENQVAEDLAALGLKSCGHDAETDALAMYLKARLAQKTEKK